MTVTQGRRLTGMLVAGLVSVALVLVALLAGWGRGVRWDPPLAARRMPAMPAPAAPIPVPALARFASIWARPLLSPDRRSPQRQYRGPELAGLELTGVIITPEVKLALLGPRTEAAPAAAVSADPPPGLRIALGARLPDGQWRLVRLAPRQAWFAGPGGESSLQLHPAVAGSSSVQTAMTSSATVTPAADVDEARRRQAWQQAVQRLQGQPAPVSSRTQ